MPFNVRDMEFSSTSAEVSFVWKLWNQQQDSVSWSGGLLPIAMDTFLVTERNGIKLVWLVRTTFPSSRPYSFWVLGNLSAGRICDDW